MIAYLLWMYVIPVSWLLRCTGRRKRFAEGCYSRAWAWEERRCGRPLP
jgi:hypothetical protein